MKDGHLLSKCSKISSSSSQNLLHIHRFIHGFCVRPFHAPPPSLLCPATGRLAGDSFFPLASWCVPNYRMEEAAVEKHAANSASWPGPVSYLS